MAWVRKLVGEFLTIPSAVLFISSSHDRWKAFVEKRFCGSRKSPSRHLIEGSTPSHGEQIGLSYDGVERAHKG
jgi:hypothetical protein